MRTTQPWPIIELAVICSMTKVACLYISIVVFHSIMHVGDRSLGSPTSKNNGNFKVKTIHKQK